MTARKKPTAQKTGNSGAPKSAKAKKPASAPTPRVRDTDWDAVERDYRTGKFTLRELSTKYKITHQIIGRHAKDHGWTKDLGVAIKLATNAKLVQDLVDKEVAKSGQEVDNAILAAAEVNTRVILKHRTDIEATRRVAADLLAEVAKSRLEPDEQELLAEILAGGSKDEPADAKKLYQARQVIAKAVDIGNRVGSVKLLADTFTKLQAAERKAFGLGDGDDGDELPGVTIKDMTGRRD